MSIKEDPPFLEFISNFRNFYVTRKAVMAGNQLYTYNTDQLIANSYQTPWKYALVGILITSLPALFIAILLNIKVDIIQIFISNSTGIDIEAMINTNNNSINTINIYLLSIFFPISVRLNSYVYGLVSLRAKNYSVKKITRNANAFLYIDGAIGLYSEMLISVTFVLSISILNTLIPLLFGVDNYVYAYNIPKPIVYTLSVLLFIAVVHRFYIMRFKIITYLENIEYPHNHDKPNIFFSIVLSYLLLIASTFILIVIFYYISTALESIKF